MDFLNTTLGTFLWKLIVAIIFVVIMIQIFKSALDSWKRTGKIISIFDEIIEGIVVLVIFAVVVSNDATTIINWLKAPILFLWNMIKTFLREILGIPLN